MENGLTGRVALVSGAGRGIGRGIAERLAAVLQGPPAAIARQWQPTRLGE